MFGSSKERADSIGASFLFYHVHVVRSGCRNWRHSAAPQTHDFPTYDEKKSKPLPDGWARLSVMTGCSYFRKHTAAQRALRTFLLNLDPRILENASRSCLDDFNTDGFVAFTILWWPMGAVSQIVDTVYVTINRQLISRRYETLTHSLFSLS